jgi:hypothetical protein
MKPRTTRETAMICVAAVLVVALLTIPFELTMAKTDTRGLLWLAAAGLTALGMVWATGTLPPGNGRRSS